MRGKLIRIVVAASVFVVAGLALSADEQGTWLSGEQVWKLKQSETVTAEIARRETRVAEELEGGSAPAWAGKYQRGDGLGVNVNVSLAPKGGFVFTWYGCLGRYDANYGAVTEKDGDLAFDFELPNSPASGPGIASAFVPVRWGDRQYLIALDQAREFANAVNSGREPCKQFCTEFLLREGDELVDATGRPEMPKDWARYLLAKPIEAAFVQVLETSVEPDTHGSPDNPYAWRRTKIRIAAGRQQGVWEGMTFYDTSPEARGIEYIVAAVGDHGATAVSTELVTGLGEDDPVTLPAKLSTRMFNPMPIVRWSQ